MAAADDTVEPLGRPSGARLEERQVPHVVASVRLPLHRVGTTGVHAGSHTLSFPLDAVAAVCGGEIRYRIFATCTHFRRGGTSLPVSLLLVVALSFGAIVTLAVWRYPSARFVPTAPIRSRDGDARPHARPSLAPSAARRRATRPRGGDRPRAHPRARRNRARWARPRPSCLPRSLERQARGARRERRRVGLRPRERLLGRRPEGDHHARRDLVRDRRRDRPGDRGPLPGAYQVGRGLPRARDPRAERPHPHDQGARRSHPGRTSTRSRRRSGPRSRAAIPRRRQPSGPRRRSFSGAVAPSGRGRCSRAARWRSPSRSREAACSSTSIGSRT